jgi:hypothetical protein
MTKRSLRSRRALEMLALVMIGDGVLAATRPTPYTLLWLGGPRLWRKTMTFLADHPLVTRAAGVAELATGLWIGLRQQAVA